jgi:hypothetical protein
MSCFTTSTTELTIEWHVGLKVFRAVGVGINQNFERARLHAIGEVDPCKTDCALKLIVATQRMLWGA